MPLRQTFFAKDCFYHIFNRGNNKNPIFFSQADYSRFLEKLKEYKDQLGISLISYCLLPNHFHLELRQNTDIPLSYFLGRLLNSYARYLGIKYELIGHIFQGRFKAKLIENESYFLQLSRYIHLNPIKEGLLQLQISGNRKRHFDTYLRDKLRQYPWSSYQEYLSLNRANLVEKDWILGSFKTWRGYRHFVEAGLSKYDLEELGSLEIFTPSPVMPQPRGVDSRSRYDGVGMSTSHQGTWYLGQHEAEV